MIEKIKGKYCGVCDVCSIETDSFDDWGDCRDWLKQNWKTIFNKRTEHWEHICDKCKNLK